MEYKKLWIALAVVLVASFSVLGGVGYHAIHNGPPTPTQVVTTDGRVVMEGEAIHLGQGVWQSIGGQEVGTVWGHGAYVAPDWSADYLHRESMFILDRWAQGEGAANYESLGVERKAALQARLQETMRRNTYDAASGRITVDPARAEAFEHLVAYYSGRFCEWTHGVCDPEGCAERCDKSSRDDVILLVDVVGSEHESSWPRRDLHAELAA